MPVYRASSNQGNLVQTAAAKLAADASTAFTTWQDLLTLGITTEANYLLIWAMGSFSMSANNRYADIRITLDGSPLSAAGFRYVAVESVASCVSARQSVTAGAHTVKVQWRVDPSSSGSVQCRPVTHSDDESATLLIEEVKT